MMKTGMTEKGIEKQMAYKFERGFEQSKGWLNLC
jgi:hypothetical protein